MPNFFEQNDITEEEYNKAYDDGMDAVAIDKPREAPYYAKAVLTQAWIDGYNQEQ